MGDEFGDKTSPETSPGLLLPSVPRHNRRQFDTRLQSSGVRRPACNLLGSASSVALAVLVRPPRIIGREAMRLDVAAAKDQPGARVPARLRHGGG